MDTSGLIDGLDRYYRTKNFPILWDAFDLLISSKRIVAPIQVWHEIEPHAKFVKTWVDENDLRMSIFTPNIPQISLGKDPIEAEKRNITKSYHKLYNPLTGRGYADPYVIAMAKVFGLTVVTGESRYRKDTEQKIPYVCRKLGIKCIEFAELVREENWSF